MGFASINIEEATFAHQNFYKGEFEVMPMKRSGLWDFFPYSWVIGGPGSFGCWGGLISTDGKKVVVTKSKFSDLAKIKKTYEFSCSDFTSVKHGFSKTGFVLKRRIPGLTMAKVPNLIVFFTFGFFMIVYPVLGKKFLRVRLDDEFENIEEFKKMLGS